MINPYFAVLALATGPACFAQSTLQAPAPAPARAAKAATVRVEASDLRVLARQWPDTAAQPVPYAMVLIPGGDTIVGTDSTKVPEYGQNLADRMRDVAGETPRHTVKVDPFYIDLTEVTNLQWKVYLDATHRKPSSALLDYNWRGGEHGGEIPDGQEQFPISNVNIPEIRDFLQWCGKRLPTEDEWTRAARGNDDRLYPWGSKWDSSLCRSGSNGDAGPAAVGSFPGGASPYGVLDMVGNVFEWVDSPFTPFVTPFVAYDLKVGKKTIPLSPAFNSTNKVYKGGGFSTVRLDSRIDTRLGLSPTSSDAVIGFRAARTEVPGVDVIRHALDRLLPPAFSKPGSLDLADIFAKEVSGYDEARHVLTSFRYVGFGHRSPSRLPPLSKMRDESINEPLPLGVLTTSEPLVMKDMKASNMIPAGGAAVAHSADAVTLIPAGEFTLAFKGKGSSKAYKEKLKQDKKNGKKPEPVKEEPKPTRGKPDAKAKDAGESAPGSGDDGATPTADEPSPGGAVVPWPGLGSIHDVQEDVDFPQDEDVVLFYNANNVVVAWVKCEEIHEAEVGPVTFHSDEEGRIWTIDFSIDSLSRKTPRFTLPIQLGGAGLR